MCVYELRPGKPLKHFYCIKLKEVLLACPPACPYHVDHPGGNLEELLDERKCINIDFITVNDGVVPVCLVIPNYTPDCDECPSKKKNSSSLFTNHEFQVKLNDNNDQHETGDEG